MFALAQIQSTLHEVTIEPENHTNSPAQNRQTSKTRISSIITALRLVYNPQPGVESQVKYANCYTIPTLLPPSWFGGKGADFVLTSSRSPHYSIHCSSQSVNWKGRGAIKNLFKVVTPSIDSSRQKVIAVCSIFSTLQYCILKYSDPQQSLIPTLQSTIIWRWRRLRLWPIICVECVTLLCASKRRASKNYSADAAADSWKIRTQWFAKTQGARKQGGKQGHLTRGSSSYLRGLLPWRYAEWA